MQDPKKGSDLWAFADDRQTQPFPVVRTSFDEIEGQFSPTDAEQQIADFVCRGVAEPAIQRREVLPRHLANAVREDIRDSAATVGHAVGCGTH
jgi:hypothetical protein